MMMMQSKYFINRQILFILLATIVYCLLSLSVLSQVLPPRPITVTFNPAEGLRFGAIFLGTSGGTIVVAADGSRGVTGGVIEANFGFQYGAAAFEVVANPGTRVSLLNGSDVILTGSNGGSMTLHIGASNPVSPFITSAIPPAYTLVNIGGTLTVGSALLNPAGTYSGSFTITFMQE